MARTEIAQPAIFSVSYSLARLWQGWGVNAEAYIGHSVGEFVAACLAGVFTLPDALRLIGARGRLMQDLPSGGIGSRRGGGWNWVGVVSGLFNPNDSGVGALERRPRHDEGYHEGGGCGRRSFAFG